MSNIADIIAWKFNNQPGMLCREDEYGTLRIVEFPQGIPSSEEQEEWALEYQNHLDAINATAFIVNIKKQIEDIEKMTLMNRAVREFMLLSAEATAAAQGVTPEQLYLANTAYKKVKDVDIQIAALRSQL